MQNTIMEMITTSSTSSKIPAATPPIIAPVSEQETIGGDVCSGDVCAADVVTEQSQPVNPGAQLHLKSSGRFTQVAPFVHGLERQLLRSVAQSSPCKRTTCNNTR